MYIFNSPFAALQRKQNQIYFKIMYQRSFDEQELNIVSVTRKRKEKSNGLF